MPYKFYVESRRDLDDLTNLLHRPRATFRDHKRNFNWAFSEEFVDWFDRVNPREFPAQVDIPVNWYSSELEGLIDTYQRAIQRSAQPRQVESRVYRSK